MKNQNLQHVFIIGCKGVPARYGGFETFVDKLVEYQKSRSIQYHIACVAEPEDYDASRARFTYRRAKCVVFPWRQIGPARAIAYDVEAMRYFLSYVEKKQIKHPVFYLLACRIGVFLGHFRKRIDALGGVLYVNPDGHEFLRAKWSAPVRCYWKYSERLTVKHAGLLVCDSKAIEKYIQREYAPYRPKTTFIAYGAETARSPVADDDEALLGWFQAHGLCAKDYYLVVGRFVPENNYETMIREFMKSKTTKKFALVTDVEDGFLSKLEKKTGFGQDKRIRFVGTVYDQALLKKIREQAYAYFHGHEVGGTNPSLLEALAATDLNLLLDVEFNREVARSGACYWTKKDGDLAALIDQVDKFSEEKIQSLAARARKRVETYYSWEYIAGQYEEIFDRRGNTCVES